MTVPSQQKALLLPNAGPDARFVVGTRAVPTPGPSQVLIQNSSVALNPADGYVRTLGIYVSEHGWPAVTGNDAAGTIAALGAGVNEWAVGDVVLYQGFWSPDRGCCQEYTLADAARIARVPGNVSVDEAATIPAALATAACALYNGPGEHGLGLVAPWKDSGRDKYAGQAALVVGGSSSVGQLAIQLLKLSGFSPIITTASARNEVYCKSAGATHVVDYNAVPYSELPAKASELLGGAQPALVFDAISIAESQEAAWAALAPHGKLVLVLHSVLGERAKAAEGKTVVMAYGAINAEENHEFGARMYGVLTTLLESGDIKPNKVEVLPGGLAGLPGGVERLETKKVSGVKLVANPKETA